MRRSAFQAELERLRRSGAGAPAANAQANGAYGAKQAFELVDRGISAADLVGLNLPDPKFAVEGLVCEGLTILGGRPKMGKSWLSLLLAWAVAGGHAIDGRPVKSGHVLLLSLEDTRRRLKSRIEMLAGSLHWPVPANLKIHTSFPRADQGGLYHAVEWLTDHKGEARLIVIDTLAKFRRPVKGAGNSYADDYESLAEIKGLADTHGVAVMVVHHTRKMPAEDPFDELSGTLAISGAADGLMVLDRRRGSDEARLFVTGRDVAEATVPLRLERESFRWHIGASTDGIDTAGRHVSPAENRIEACMAWLREFLGRFAYPSKEIDEAGKLAGFPFSLVKAAKAKLNHKKDGDLYNTSHLPGKGGEWWSGFGRPETWTLRPDTPASRNYAKTGLNESNVSESVGSGFEIPD